jgi:hypothetical protein
MERFIIKGNKKMCLLLCIAGIIIVILGSAILYASLNPPDNFLKLFGWATIILGLSIILVNIKNLNASLVIVDTAGILFNIVVFSKGIFIPWQDIINIDSDAIGAAGQVGWKVRAKCLVFTLSESCSKKMPIFLKSYLVFTDSECGGLWVGHYPCSQTQILANARNGIKQLNSWREKRK